MSEWANKEFCLGLDLFSVKYDMIDRESIGKSSWSHYRKPSMKAKNYRLPLPATLPAENHIVWQFTLCSSNIKRFKTAWLLPSYEQFCLNTLATVLSIELQLFFPWVSINSCRVKLVLFTVKLRWKLILSVLCLQRLYCLSQTSRVTKCERTASDGGCCPRSNRRHILFVF